MKRLIVVLFCFVACRANAQQPQSSEHVPPEPPSLQMHDMTYRAMVEMMQMDDTSRVGKIVIDRLEWRHDDRDIGVWDAMAFYGGDYNKLAFKTEGEREAGRSDARLELLWDRIVDKYWNLQLGAREDVGSGPPRSWVAIGVQGMAPYWIDVDASLYMSDAGHAAARVKLDYDLLLTQRWILRADAEVNAYSQADYERHIGAGLSSIDTGLRLRYEVRREFAPYVGVAWQRRFGATARENTNLGIAASDVEFVAGLRVWF